MGTSDLLYSTYVGGDSTSLGMGIALDISGNACVTGYASDKSYTTSNFFNVTIGAYQTVSGGRDDVIVFKLPITFGSPPGAPTGVSAGSPSLNSITVGWTAPVDTGTTALVGYDVYYGTTSPTIKFGTRFSSSATSGVVTGLLPGTTYYFAVRAANSVGVSDPSSPSASAATTNVVPGAPVLDTATAGNAQVALAWHAGTDLGTPISGYKVYRNATASPIYTGTSLACNDTGLINGVVYSYHVVATNTLGDSPSSNIMTATPDVVPNPPTGVSASSPTLTSITVSWTAPVSNGGTALTGYDVFYGTSAIPTTKFGSTLGASTFSVVVTSLSPGIQYNFTVKAINSFGASTASSPIATATTTNVVPGAPTIGTATPGYSSVTVTWSPPTNTGSPITGYKVFYGTSANPSTNFVSALSTDTGATVTGLNPGTLYFFNVVAVNAAGPGATSSDVSTTTTDVVPGAPVLDSVVPGNTTAVITWHAGINNGSPVTAYKVYRNGTVAPVYAGLLLTYTDTGLINGVDYSYTVMATNLMGDSISSNTVHATPDVIPGTPVLGTITVGLNSVTVSWSAPYNAGSSITGYKVFYGTSATPTVNFASALAGDSQLVITGLNAATQYYFNIVAINAAGGSVASVDRTATTTDVIPAAPSMGTATPHLNSVTLVWTAPLANGGSPITVYRVYYGTIANPSLNYVSVSGTATGATVAGLDAGTHYYFDLVAVNSAGPGPASTDISTNTTNIVPEAPSEVVVLYPTLSSAIVSWAAPIANGGTPITGYEVYFGILLADKVKFGSTLAANATNVNVTDLQPGTYYSFEVRALNAAGAGNGSTVTASTINIVPGTPTSVEASAGVFNVTLSWTAPAANGGTDITGYRVYQVTGGSSVLLATLGLVTQYVDSGFAYNTIKTYQVSAINALGESVRTEPVTGIALFPPAPVTGLNVTRGDNGVVLTWNQTVGNASSAPVLKYAIFRGTDSTNLQLIDWVDGSLGTYVDRNTTSTETYYYEIAPVAGTTYAGEPHSNMVVELGVPHNTDWTLIGGVLVFVLLLAFLLIFVVLKRRKKKEEDK
jgi:fibronectin type 3 domain-containing protein